MVTATKLMHIESVIAPFLVLTVAEESKRLQEINSLTKINDSFVKIVVVRDRIIRWHDEAGILYIGIEDFTKCAR